MDSGKSFELERHPGFARLVLNPNLNAYHWADIERSAAEILTALESAKAAGVIVDLSPLDYLGSAQLTLLVRVWKAIKASGGRMVVLVTAPVVREVLNTAGLSNLWEFSDSLASAYQTLGLQKDGRSTVNLLWPVVGLAALGGLLASVLKLVNLDPRLSLIVQLGCAGAALAVGVWMFIRASGMRKNLGIGMAVAAVILMIIGIMRAPFSGTPAPAPQEAKTDDKSGEKPTVDTVAEKEDAGEGAGEKKSGAEVNADSGDKKAAEPKETEAKKEDE